MDMTRLGTAFWGLSAFPSKHTCSRCERSIVRVSAPPSVHNAGARVARTIPSHIRCDDRSGTESARPVDSLAERAQGPSRLIDSKIGVELKSQERQAPKRDSRGQGEGRNSQRGGRN